MIWLFLGGPSENLGGVGDTVSYAQQIEGRFTQKLLIFLQKNKVAPVKTRGLFGSGISGLFENLRHNEKSTW